MNKKVKAALDTGEWTEGHNIPDGKPFSVIFDSDIDLPDGDADEDDIENEIPADFVGLFRSLAETGRSKIRYFKVHETIH